MDGDVDIYILHHLLSSCCSFMSPSYAYRLPHTRICQSLYLKPIGINVLTGLYISKEEMSESMLVFSDNDCTENPSGPL